MEDEVNQRFQCLRIDYTVAFHDALKNLSMTGIRNVGMIIDREMLSESGLESAYCRVFGQHNRKYLRIIDRSRERGFKVTYELVFNHPEVEGIVAGSPLIADGVAKALDILGRTEIPIIAVKDGNWIEDNGGFAGFISLSHDAIGVNAVDALLASIEQRPHRAIGMVQAKYEAVPPLTAGLSRHSGTIHFAMFDCPAARALEMLSRAYSRQSGVNVSFDFMGYNELDQLLYGKDAAERYDGYMLDVVWLSDLAENGLLLPLEDYHGMATPINSGFLDHAVEQYSVYDNLLLGLPFMSGAEFLYYQKNLFEDGRLCRLYERQTGTELRPPTTWDEFNAVARFFTRTFNPDSPVRYGLATVSGKNVFTPVAFLPYLWSLGGDLFDAKGNVTVNSPEAAEALERFLEGFSYSDCMVSTHSWRDVVARFKNGDYAMAILYDSHAVDLNDYTTSRVAGNLGYTTIPGGVSVMGGWNLGLSPGVRNRVAALEFVRWSCGEQIAVPLSLLGGSPLRKSCFAREDIRAMYPWKSITEKSHAQSRQRMLPASFIGSIRHNSVYVDIVAAELTKCIKGNASIAKALSDMEKKLARLVKRTGSRHGRA